VSEGGLHPNPNACSLVNSQLGAGSDRGRGPVDPVDHDWLRCALALIARTVHLFVVRHGQPGW
jgi:hypothetical protein